MDAREQRELRLECLKISSSITRDIYETVGMAEKMYAFVVGPKHEPVNVARGPDGKFVSLNEDPPAKPLSWVQRAFGAAE